VASIVAPFIAPFVKRPLCDEEQGFLLDKPLTAEAFGTLLHARTTAARP